MKLATFVVGTFLCLWIGGAEAKVEVIIDGMNLTLKNDHFQYQTNGKYATALYVKGKNLIGNMGRQTSFYIDFNNGSVIHPNPSFLKLINQTDDLVHVAYYHNSTSDLSVENNLLVTSSVSGIYQYIIIKNNAGKVLKLGELRMLCRLDPTLMKNVHNGKISMQPHRYTELNKYKKIQDETWQLPDGSYYSKYDLAGYVRERNFFGVYGGGYGAWFIHPSHEYYSGGPLKQDLIVHQESLMAVYMTGGHFGTRGLTMEHGFEKMYGPWLIYFNTGNDSALLADVQHQANTEIAKWPYSFISDPLYPLKRGTVTGRVFGKKSMVVLSPPDEVFDHQTKGYSYNAEANNGSFSIANVRPGTYTVSVYPLAGASAGTLLQSNVTVSAGQTVNTGDFTIQEPSDVIWQIGEADRRSSEFIYSNEKRNYKWFLEPPATLTFKVGSDNCTQNWYYAQTKLGTWTIEFTDTADGRPREIMISIAAVTRKPKLHVHYNGKYVGSVGSSENDSAIYRGAVQSGNYHYKQITVPAASIKSGTNYISIDLNKGELMYDCIVYTRG